MEGGKEANSAPMMAASFSSVDSHTLLRASPIKLVLSGFGAILAISEGSAATYELSEPVEHMHVFLSHNWSTPRFTKFAVLALHYNFVPALVLTSAVMCVLGVLTALGELPMVPCRPLRAEPVNHSGICASLLGPFVFVGLLFTWHELAGRVGLMKERVFLDKTCIHQVDPVRKQKGILSLAAFLERTDGMLVIYTPDYLRRLWTAFELASLLILYPDKDLLVMPTFFLRPVVVGHMAINALLMLLFIVRLRFSSLDFGVQPIDLNTFGALIGGVFIAVVTWRSQVAKQNLLAAARDFSLSRAACAVEEDRALVIRSVEEFLRLKGRVHRDASQEEAMRTFEEIVQREIPNKIIQAHGTTGFPYMYMVVAFAPWCFRAVDWVGVMVHDGKESGVVFFFVALNLTMAVFVMPLISALSMLLMEQGLNISGCVGTVMRLGAAVAACALTVGVSLGTIFMVTIFEHFPTVATSVLLVVIAIVAFLNWYVHYRIARQRVELADRTSRESGRNKPEEEDVERLGLTANVADN